MLAWFQENLGTIAVLLIVVAIVAAIIVKMVKDKKTGRSSCGCGCSSCGMQGACGGNRREKKQ